MPKPFAVKLTQPALQIAKIAKTRGKLRSWGELAQCFLRFWAQVQGDFELTSQWATMSRADQGALDAALLENVLAGKKVEREWMRSEIVVAVDEWLREHKTYPRTKPISEMLAMRIAALANEKAASSLIEVPMGRPFTVRLSPLVYEIAREARTRGGFRGWSEVIEAFIRYWALAQGELATSAKWIAMDPEKRDIFDGELLGGVIAEKKAKGSWLKHEIYVATDEWTRALMNDPALQVTALEVREQMMRIATGKAPK